MNQFTEFNILELKGVSLITDLNYIDNPMTSRCQYIYNNQQNYFIKGRPEKYIQEEFERVQLREE